MKQALGLISFAFLSLLATGCGSDEGSDDDGAGGAPACNAALTADAVNNYSFSSTLSFPPVAVRPDTELTFSWGSVTTDFLGHPVDPAADISSVNVMLWALTQEELEIKLNADDLAQRNLAVVATLDTGNTATEAALFDFTSVGMPITPEMILPYVNADSYPPAENTYTVMIASGNVIGEGTRMIQAFKLDPASTNTHVELTDDSTHLEYTVDMDALTPTRIPGAVADITLEWRPMTVNALGNPFVATQITQVLVARYAQSVAELEARFLDLDLIEADRWRGEVVSGTSVDFSTLTNEAGEPFPGIDGTGTWVAALICGGCRNPAPWYLTILEPCSR